MTLLTGWRPYVIAAVVVGALLALLLVTEASDHPGDSAMREEINNANCGELRDLSDEALRVGADGDSTSAELDRAVAYSNAANDRMEELNCFGR